MMFDAIKSTLTAATVAERYGLTITRGKALCPFHAEKTPSMTLKGSLFHCFGCGVGGTVIDLAQKLNGLSTPLDAARLLDRDFSLGLFSDKPLTPYERRKAHEAARKRERDKQLVTSLEAWRERTLDTLAWYYLYLRAERARLAPKDIDSPISSGYASVLQTLDCLDNLYDPLAFGYIEDWLKIYKYSRQEVMGLERFRQGYSDSAGA